MPGLVGTVIQPDPLNAAKVFSHHVLPTRQLSRAYQGAFARFDTRGDAVRFSSPVRAGLPVSSFANANDSMFCYSPLG